MIEVLVALLAGVIGGILSRWIPLPKKTPPLPHLKAGGSRQYEVKLGETLLYAGDDLHMAKAQRGAYPGAVLIADGVNRG